MPENKPDAGKVSDDSDSQLKDNASKKGEKIVESYNIISDGVELKIDIAVKNFKHVYKIVLPEISVATVALLDDIKEKLIGAVEANTNEIFDSKLMNELKVQLKTDAFMLLDETLPNLDQKTKEQFSLNLLNDLLGLGNVELFLSDDLIEEIVINSAKEPVRIYHKKY